MIKKVLVLLILVAVVIGGAWFFSRSRDKTGIQKETRFLMDTICTIQVPGPVKVRAEIDKAMDRVEEISKKFNVHDPESPLWRFNQFGTPIEDPEIVALVALSLQVARDSDGAFDITIYPVLEVWGFYKPQTPHLPQKGDIAEALKKVGWQNIVISNGKVTKKNPDVKIDLGGIAKGYAVSEAGKVLVGCGITNALIDLGGDVYAMGKVNNKPWKVGLVHPRGRGPFCGLDMSDLSVSTSGDYERFFIKDGIRYHHIFDPKTGYPTTNVMSISIISSDATFCDAYDTAIFVMGPEKGMKLVESFHDADAFRSRHQDEPLGMKLIESFHGAEGIMVTSSGKILVSSGLKDVMTMEHLPKAENPDESDESHP